MLGHDLEMACTKFHENRLTIDGEINEKHTHNCVLDYRHVCIFKQV